MKTQLSIFSTVIASGFISAIPAQAALFSNEGIWFEEETTVEFEFLQSNSWWQADFGVKNLDTGEAEILLVEDLNMDPGSGWANDNLGTAGTAVTQTSTSFTFEANTNYTLFLESLNPDGNPDTPYNIQYSTTNENPTWYRDGEGLGKQGDGLFEIGAGPNDYDKNNFTDSGLNGLVIDGQQRAFFKQDGENSTKIFFEDNTTWGDNDFDDFVVRAHLPGTPVPTPIPEPAILAGLGFVVGRIFLSRSYKKQK